jgi:hypothetical protein
MYPWTDWHEWVSVFHLLFSNISIMSTSSSSDQREIDLIKDNSLNNGEPDIDKNLKKALGRLTLWTARNVAGD